MKTGSTIGSGKGVRCATVELLETRLAVLGHKAGPVLFQLPPQMPADRDRLASFMKMLNPARRYSFWLRASPMSVRYSSA